MKSAIVDFDTPMTNAREQKLLGYVESGEVEALRGLPLGDILPQAIKSSLIESAQREAKQDADDEAARKTRRKNRGDGAADGTQTQTDEAPDGRRRAAAALMNPAYRPLAPLGSHAGGEASSSQSGTG